jgi:hypothetical protein
MAKTTPKIETQPLDLSPEESRAYFDAEVQALLGISGDEFLRRLDAGDYADMPDDAEHADIIYLAILGSFGRRQP